MGVPTKVRVAVLCLALVLGMGAVARPLQAQRTSDKQPKELAKEQQKFARLQQHVASQKGIKQAQTLAQLAHLSFDFAHAAYGAGDATRGQAQLQSARSFAAQAMQVVQQEAATGHTHGMKKVEMEFQQISFRLQDLSMSVDFRQRPPIDAAQKYFAQQRDQVLALMFAPPKKAGKEEIRR